MLRIQVFFEDKPAIVAWGEWHVKMDYRLASSLIHDLPVCDAVEGYSYCQIFQWNFDL